MLKKVMFVTGLGSMLMAGGCSWSTAHQIVIHAMSLAAGISGLNDLFNLGL